MEVEDLEKLLKLEQALDIPMKDRFHKTLTEEEIKMLTDGKIHLPIKDRHKKLYEKRIYVSNLGGEYWYTLEVRRLYFLWRGRWKKIPPAMQPTYEDVEKLFINYTD